jgi:HSP20 family protein
MIATLAHSRHAVVRAVRSYGLPNRAVAMVSARRPLSVRAYKDGGEADKAAAAEAPKAAEEKQLASQQSGQHLARHAPGPMRLPSLFREMEREFDSLTRGFFGDDLFSFSPLRSPLWQHAEASLPAPGLPNMMRLATDIHEGEKAWTITADVPGMDKENIKLQVLEDTLTISGERKEEHKEEVEGKPVRYERSFGSFTRSFSLPPNVDASAITASAKDGVLTVTLPKKELQPPAAKDIPIA